MRPDEFISNGNVRRDLGDLTDLVLSIAQRGVLVPIAYYQVGDRKIVWDGHRRLRAVAIINSLNEGGDIKPLLDGACFRGTVQGRVDDVPAIEMIPPRDTAEHDEYQLLSATLRKDLNPLEEAQALQSLLNSGWSLEKVAASIGRSDSYVSRRSRLATLHPDFQEALAQGKLAPRAAEMLLALKDDSDEGVRKSLLAAGTVRAISARVQAANHQVSAPIESEEIEGDPLTIALLEQTRAKAVVAIEALGKLRTAYGVAPVDLGKVKEAAAWLF